MDLEFRAIDLGRDRSDVDRFLRASAWPFHSVTRLTANDLAAFELESDSTRSFWALDGAEPVALIRLQDLDDIDEPGGGCPLFDLRVAELQRRQGVGSRCVRWLTDHLFGAHPTLHRIEANTRADNVAMQAVLERCGFLLEGRLRETWPTATGDRLDTMVYGILRREWDPVAP